MMWVNAVTPHGKEINGYRTIEELKRKLVVDLWPTLAVAYGASA
jgi:hypothetical protein